VNFPSLYLVWSQARKVLRRFPFVMAAAALGAAGAIMNEEWAGNHPRLEQAVASVLVGLPLFLLIHISAERWRWSRSRKIASFAAGVGLLGLVYLMLGDWPNPVGVGRYVQLQATLHFAVAVVPFVVGNGFNAFWQFNRLLFVRFLMAGVFSAVLFGGLAVALAATDELLGVNIRNNFYFYLWVVIALVFQSWFFLGGIPEEFDALESRSDYPTPLRVFAQFILIPLVSLYLLLLTVYLGKIIVTTTWPSGSVGYLVSSVAVAGVLTVLLAYPLREQEEHKWVGIFSRWYFIGLLPSVVMALMAAWKRIDQYGFTENRYALIVLALWLGAIAIFYATQGIRNIKVLPASLAVLFAVTMFGPWSAYAVSKRSQLNRLERIFVEQELLAEGILSPASGDVPFEARREISAILRFLFEREETKQLDRWLNSSLASIDTVQATASGTVYRAGAGATAVMTHLNMRHVNQWESSPVDQYYMNAETGGVFDIAGYDYAAMISIADGAISSDTLLADGMAMVVGLSDGLDSVVVKGPQDEVLGAAAISPALDEVWRRMRESYQGSSMPQEIMRLDGGGSGIRFVFFISSGRLSESEDDGFLALNLAGDLYFSLR